MKTHLLLFFIFILSLCSCSRNYYCLKVINTNNYHHYFIKPGQVFNAMIDSGEKKYTKLRMDSVNGITGIIHTTILSKNHHAFGQVRLLGTDEIYKIKVQPRSKFKTITKTVFTSAGVIAVSARSIYAYSTNDIETVFVLSVAALPLALLGPQILYNTSERRWLRWNRRLTKGKNLRIEIEEPTPALQ